MTEPARRLLSLLGGLPDGVALPDVDALVPGEGAGAASVLRRRALAFDEAGRLRTHPPLRLHVDTAHPPAAAEWERAVAHYRGLVTELGPRGGALGGADAVRRLAAETANLRATLLTALGDDDPRPALDAIHAAVELARFTGIELDEILEAGFQAAQATNEGWLLARAHWGLGGIARARYEEAFGLYERIDDAVLDRDDSPPAGQARSRRTGTASTGRSRSVSVDEHRPAGPGRHAGQRVRGQRLNGRQRLWPEFRQRR